MRRLKPAPRLVPLLLSVLLGVGVFALPADAAGVAVLPAEATGLLPGAREALDGAIHTALGQAGLEVQPVERTARFIKDAVDAGLDCSLTEDDCALRAAVAAGADAVVVPRATRIDNRVVMVLRLLSLDGTPARSAAARLEEGAAADASLLALARRLRDPSAGEPTPLPVPFSVEPASAVITVDGRLQDSRETAAGVLWLMPGPHLVRASADGHDASQIVVDVPPDRLLDARTLVLEPGFPALGVAGIGVAAVGGLIAATGVVGVGVTESTLAQPLDLAARSTTQTVGRIFVGAAIVGVVAVAGGAALAIVGSNP